MRFFSFILILLTMLLSSSPCCEGDECCHETGKECPGNSVDNHHSEESANTCLPFMVCGSCAGFVIFPMYPDLNPEIGITNDLLVPYSQKYFGNYYQSFWQPPKIS